MKILVTGGSGMVGQYIKHLYENKTEHTFVFLSSSMCDLRNRHETLCYFQENSFDYIIHLAANVGGLYKNMRRGIEMFSANIKINENVLEACHNYNIDRGIFILSSCIYPANPSKFPMDESMVHESPPHNSNRGYAYAKRMLEMQCDQYNKTYNTEFICLTPVNLYGMYDNFKLGESHVIPELMHRMYLTKKMDNQEKFGVYGTGKAYRQFIYAGDFAKIIYDVLFDSRIKSGNLIICNDEVRIKDIVDLLCEVVNMDKENIVYDTSKSDGCLKKTVSNEKFKKLYENFKFMELKEGLSKMYKWFDENYKNIRK